MINSNVLSQYLLEDLLPFIVHEGAPEENSRSYSACALRDNLTKKLVTEVKPDADEKALEKFLSVNERCGSWRLLVENLEDELLVGHLKDVLWKFVHAASESSYHRGSDNPVLGSFDQIFDHGNLGPGSSVGSPANDFYTKLFASKLTTTSLGLNRAYTAYIKRYPDWLKAEMNRQELFGPPSVVAGNRLTFVPKSDEVSRTICVEPVLNMFGQQGVKFLLERRLKSFFGIDLSCQQIKNRELARIGSERYTQAQEFGRGDVPVTIDLSSASDSLSMSMMREFFPRDFLSWLELLRCERSQLPSGQWLDLNMISTMGNAFTFPLQTILFSAVVTACYRTAGLESLQINPYGTSLGSWGVNGDDIICPAFLSRKVLRLLSILGFQVNADKTFVEGPFRESCGADFHKGVDVRPVFVKKLEGPQDLYSLINRLNLWSYEKGIPLRRTVRYLLAKVPRYEVPPWEAVDSGIRIPLTRWTSSLRRDRNGTIAYKRWIPRSPRMTIDTEQCKIFVPRGMKPIRFNPEGLYLAFLKGHITNGTILVRSDKVRYVTKVGKAPSWEQSPTMPNPFKGSAGGPDLERLAYVTV